MNAEYCLMGIILNNPGKFEDLKIFGNIFTKDTNKLYLIINNLYEKNNKFTKEAVLDFISEDKHFSQSIFYEIYESEWDIKKYEMYLNIVLTKYYKELFKKKYLEICNDDYKNYLDMKQKMQNVINDIKEPAYMDYADGKKICYNMLDKLRNDKKPERINSCIRFFDEFQGGYGLSDYILIGAGESVGKTSYIIWLILQQLKKGIKVGFFSLEMNAIDILQLMACSLSGVDNNKIDNGYLDQVDMDRYIRAVEKIYEWDNELLFIDDKINEISRIRQKARDMKNKGVNVIYIDYLHMIEVDSVKRLDEYNELKIVSREIKGSCKELEIPHVVLACITKEGKKDSELSLYHIRGNGKIANDIDIGMLINEMQSAIDGDFNKRLVEFLVRKNRNGKKGSYRMKFLPAIRRFEEL